MTKDDLQINGVPLFNKNPLRAVTKAKLIRSIIQDDYLDLTVESVKPMEFHLEDKIEVDGRDYFLNLNPKAKKNNSRNFVYDLRFEGIGYLLRKIKLFNRDSQNRKTDFNFPLTTDLEGFLQLIINNANHYSNKWILCSDIPSVGTKTITFSNQNCLSALQDVATEFDIEFDFEKSGNKYVLEIGDLGHNLTFAFEYGKGKGLYSLTRQRLNQTEVVTRLYGFGSEENLPNDYRNFSQKLRMPDRDYVENQELIDIFGFVEDIHESDIKPEFEGRVSDVIDVGEDKVEFSSNDMDFNLKSSDSNGTDYLIEGQTALIHFNSGRLAGYDFEINDYNHSGRKFIINKYEDNRGLKIPDNGAFEMQEDDRFTILNIRMPESYITEAEEKLEREVEKEYEKISKNNIKYKLDVDPFYMRNKIVRLGDTATVKDDDLNIDSEIRIVKLDYDVLEDKYTFDLADTYEVSLVKEIVNDIHKVEKGVNENRAEVRRSYLRGYKQLEELQESIFDPDGYLDPERIRPLSIETNMLSVGAKSQRFNLEEVVFTPNYQGDKNKVHISDGTLVHFTIDDSNIAEWEMSSHSETSLSSSDTYYIYARCNKSGNTGNWLVTTDQLDYDGQSGYWTFLVALIYKPYEDTRLIDILYGATWIQGNQITTGRIQSVDGGTYFDLDEGKFVGEFTFSSTGKDIQETIEDIETESGSDGKNSYIHFAWANNSDGTDNFSNTEPGNRTHIGVYSDFSESKSNDPSDYIWSKVQGPSGASEDMTEFIERLEDIEDNWSDGDFDALVTLAQENGGTIIKGGYIKTDVIRAVALVTDVLKSESIEAKKLKVTDGSKIGGFDIDNEGLKNSDRSAWILIGGENSRDSVVLGPSRGGGNVQINYRDEKGLVIKRVGGNSTKNALEVSGGSNNKALKSTGSVEFNMSSSDAWDAPGVLAGGQVRDNLQIDKWSIDPLNISYIVDGNGNHRINHGLGHTDYQVIISNGNRNADLRMETKSSNYFTFDTSLGNQGAWFIMIGRNKN